jgi:hypothetical protein
LKNDLHLTPKGTHFIRRQSDDLFAFELDLAARRFDQPQQAPSHGRLPAARFSYKPQRLALANIERNIIDSADDVFTVLYRKMLDEAFYR